jgi:hypothetical protein
MRILVVPLTDAVPHIVTSVLASQACDPSRQRNGGYATGLRDNHLDLLAPLLLKMQRGNLSDALPPAGPGGSRDFSRHVRQGFSQGVKKTHGLLDDEQGNHA